MRVGLAATFLVVSIGIASCTTPVTINETEWMNPDPEIERLHVSAYNLDLGIGVAQDRIRANELYLQAAKAGDPRSMMNYAINLANGEGAEADLIDAYSWTETARFLTQNMQDKKIKWRVRGLNDELRKELSPAQIEDGQRRAKIKIDEIAQRKSISDH